jgi:hypothetical protein
MAVVDGFGVHNCRLIRLLLDAPERLMDKIVLTRRRMKSFALTGIREGLLKLTGNFGPGGFCLAEASERCSTGLVQNWFVVARA